MPVALQKSSGLLPDFAHGGQRLRLRWRDSRGPQLRHDVRVVRPQLLHRPARVSRRNPGPEQPLRQGLVTRVIHGPVPASAVATPPEIRSHCRVRSRNRPRPAPVMA